jgi:predicted amidohydrolase YtcJ
MNTSGRVGAAAVAVLSSLSLLAIAGPSTPAAGGPADLVLVNGAVYTQDGAQPWAEAVAVRGGRYAAVGSNAAVRGLQGPHTQVIDLHGRMLMPGLIDAHVHAVEGGNEDLYGCVFAATSTPEQIRATLMQCHHKAAPGEWIQGGSWDSAFFTHQKIASPRKWLDEIVGDRPVILRDDSHHNVWVNSAALRLACVGADAADPQGGSFEREALSRQPNGIALEAAAELVQTVVPQRSAEQLRRSVLHAQELAHRLGLIGLKEADTVEPSISAYHEVEKSGRLSMYVTTCISTLAMQAKPDTPMDFAAIERIRAAYGGGLLATDCVKTYLDGVPTPARTAAMLEPYVPDAQGATTRGMLHVAPATLNADLIELDQRGFTVKMHAAGDWSIREGLDAIAATRNANPGSTRQHELAHAGYIAPEDIGRFAELNAVADQSPVIWYPSPVIDAVTAAVGDERGHHYWPTRTLVASHAPMAAGSDWPSVVPSMDPWGGVEAMVTRSDPYKNSAEKLWPEEAITLADALRIYTLGGAAALRREQDTGSIVVGKSADFVVLDRNLFKIPATGISDVRVDLTVFQGREVYRRR